MGTHAHHAETLTAAAADLVRCLSCGLLCRIPSQSDEIEGACPRCGDALHRRKPGSLAKTWALVITALILYLPANLLPIMHTTSMGNTQSDTIISGVIYFMTSGSWHLALIILVASILVPLFKILILLYLLLSVRYGWLGWLVDRTRLYRLTDVIGRWSMVDIFAVTTMVALVKMEALGTVEAGSAAPFFGAVVVITMLAAACFDPRLIWDGVEEAQ